MRFAEPTKYYRSKTYGLTCILDRESSTVKYKKPSTCKSGFMKESKPKTCYDWKWKFPKFLQVCIILNTTSCAELKRYITSLFPLEFHFNLKIKGHRIKIILLNWHYLFRNKLKAHKQERKLTKYCQNCSVWKLNVSRKTWIPISSTCCLWN